MALEEQHEDIDPLPVPEHLVSPSQRGIGSVLGLGRALGLPALLSEERSVFTSYAPRLFRRLRQCFGVSEEQFAASLGGDPAAMQKNFSEGASGSFFYFTEARDYMVKTLNKGEYQFLRSLLPDYVRFMSRNPHSLICRFFGLFSITMYGHVGKWHQAGYAQGVFRSLMALYDV